MTVFAGIVAWSLCGCLLLLTLAFHRPRFRWLRTLKNSDLAVFIPTWRFFAPNPQTTDMRLLWRDRLSDGTVSCWRELFPPAAGLRRAVWNPRKRRTKCMTDAAMGLAGVAGRNSDSRRTLISLPYLMLLHGVMTLPASRLSVARQFLLLETSGNDQDGQLTPLCVSPWHAISFA